MVSKSEALKSPRVDNVRNHVINFFRPLPRDYQWPTSSQTETTPSSLLFPWKLIFSPHFPDKILLNDHWKETENQSEADRLWRLWSEKCGSRCRAARARSRSQRHRHLWRRPRRRFWGRSIGYRQTYWCKSWDWWGPRKQRNWALCAKPGGVWSQTMSCGFSFYRIRRSRKSLTGIPFFSLKSIWDPVTHFSMLKFNSADFPHFFSSSSSATKPISAFNSTVCVMQKIEEI